MPPGVLEDRLAVIRKALADTFADPTSGRKRKAGSRSRAAPRNGEQIQEVIRSSYSAPSQVLDRLQKVETTSP